MANVNFGSFSVVVPSGEDFLVGFRGLSETRTTVKSLTALNQSTMDKVNNLIIDGATYISVYSTVQGLSTSWSAPYTYVNSNSAVLNSVVSTLRSNSANWNTAYAIATAVSATPTDLAKVSSYVYGELTNQVTSNSITLLSANTWNATTNNLNANLSRWNATASTVLGAPGINPLTQPWTAWARTFGEFNTRRDYINNLFLTVLGFTATSEGTYFDNLTITPVTTAEGWKTPTWDYAYNQSIFFNSNAVLKSGDTNPASNNPLFTGTVTTNKTLSTQFIYGNEFVTKLYVDAVVQTNTISGNFNPSLYYLASQLYTKTQTDAAIDSLKTTYTLTSSVRWSNVWNTVQTTSGQWGGSVFRPLTGRWETSYTTLNANSADWLAVETAVQVNSASWSSVYTTTQNNSADWLAVETAVQVNSANWNTAYDLSQQSQTQIASISAGSLFLDSNIIEVTSNLVINNGNQSTYNGKILHVSSDINELSITFGVNLPQNFTLSIVNLGIQDILILPNDGSVVRAANYRIYGNQFATVTFYKYKNLIYGLGTVPPAR